jgi:hypothetical protein
MYTFHTSGFGCQMHQTMLARRKAILPWAPLKEACQRAVQCKHSETSELFSQKKEHWSESICIQKWDIMQTRVLRCPTNVFCKVLSIIVIENLSWENFDAYEVTWRSGCTFVKQLIQVPSVFSPSKTHNGTTNLVCHTQVYWEPRVFNC